jgi:hypothetical protein
MTTNNEAPPEARATDPVAGDANTAARWVVLINREGEYDIRTFDDELAARESFDTNSAQWSDSYLCAIVRGPGPNPGQPGALEPMFQEIVKLRRQLDGARKDLADLRERIEAVLRLAPALVPPAPAAPEVAQAAAHDRAHGPRTRDKNRKVIEIGDSVLLYTRYDGPVFPPRIELVTDIQFDPEDEGEPIVPDKTTLVLGTGETWLANDTSLAQPIDRYGNLVRVGDLILDATVWIKVTGFWMLNEEDEIRAHFENGGGWRVSELSSKAPPTPINTKGLFARALRKGMAAAEATASVKAPPADRTTPFDPSAVISVGQTGDPFSFPEGVPVVVVNAGPAPAAEPSPEPVARPAMSEEEKAAVRAEFIEEFKKHGPPPADVPLVGTGGIKGPRDKNGRPVRVGDEIRIRGTKRWVLISRIQDEHGTTWAVLPDNNSSICIPTSETRMRSTR